MTIGSTVEPHEDIEALIKANIWAMIKASVLVAIVCTSLFVF
jgi:hypothetical protein